MSQTPHKKTPKNKLSSLQKEENRKNSGAKGFAAASHVISGILVGLGLGHGIDTVFGTEPWGIIILIPIGFIAGMLNMVRALD